MNLAETQSRLQALFDTPPDATPAFPPRGSRLAIYGAGNCGREVARLLRAGGWEPVAFLDAKAAEGVQVEGLPCVAPQSDSARKLAQEGLSLILAVFNFTADCGAIALNLREIGFTRIISIPELHETFGEALPSRFWLERKKWFREHQREILQCLQLWSDDRSRALFADLVELRLTHNLQLLRDPDREGQYFPADLPPFPEPIRFIDGGAYTGDTLPALFSRRVEALAAFEPDLANFAKLSEAVKRLANPPLDIALFPLGLDDCTAMKRFQSGESAASALCLEGDSVIQVAAVDDVLPTFAPTYIKLDIEGAEPEALRGSRETIRLHRPAIAACIYHLPDHLWRVPFLLHELAPTHRLFLRIHGFNGFDAVAYALPT